MTICGQDSPGLMRPLGEATMGLEHRGMEITGGHLDLEKLIHSFTTGTIRASQPSDGELLEEKAGPDRLSCT